MIALAMLIGMASPAVKPPVKADPFVDLIRRANARHAVHDLGGALRACEEAHQLDPTRFEGLACQAHLHNDIGFNGPRTEAEPEYRRAIDAATQAQAMFPDRAEGHFWASASYGNLALLKGGKEKVRLARNFERDAKRAIELDPTFAPPYVGLGIYYRELAELNWFLRQFAKLLAGGVPKGSLEDSLRMLEKAVELDPDLVLARYMLGRTLESMGRKDEAAAAYEKAIATKTQELRDERDKTDALQRLKKMGKQQ